MKENLRFVFFLALALLALRFGFRLLVRLVQAVYALVPMLVRAWYISIPVAALIYFIIQGSIASKRKKRRFSNLDPDDEINADAEVTDEPEESDDEWEGSAH